MTNADEPTFSPQEAEIIRQLASELLDARYSERYRQFAFPDPATGKHISDKQSDPWLSEYIVAQALDNKARLGKLPTELKNPGGGDAHRETLRTFAISIVSSMWTGNNIDNLILGEELHLGTLFAEYYHRYQETLARYVDDKDPMPVVWDDGQRVDIVPHDSKSTVVAIVPHGYVDSGSVIAFRCLLHRTIRAGFRMIVISFRELPTTRPHFVINAIVPFQREVVEHDGRVALAELTTHQLALLSNLGFADTEVVWDGATIPVFGTVEDGFAALVQ
jgi:hypothetical protein